MTESPRLELSLLCVFLFFLFVCFINSVWNHRSSRSVEEWTWTEIGFGSTYTLRGARSTDTHPTCSPGGQGEEGARQTAVRPGVKHSTFMLFFFIVLYIAAAVWVWRTWSPTVFVCALRQARIICMVCYKLSRAGIACQNSSTCVCVSDCSCMGISPGPPPPTHTLMMTAVLK